MAWKQVASACSSNDLNVTFALLDALPGQQTLAAIRAGVLHNVSYHLPAPCA